MKMNKHFSTNRNADKSIFESNVLRQTRFYFQDVSYEVRTFTCLVEIITEFELEITPRAGIPGELKVLLEKHISNKVLTEIHQNYN